MDQWQGCLAPVCQLALRRAHGTVIHRGGDVVTPEDLLLALLDVDEALVPFLNRWGVDLDELVRTIQGEQPLRPQSGSEAGLSTSLVEWLASARELYESPWLTTHHLLSSLVYAVERFKDKAYVAVLEQVPLPAWEALPQVLPSARQPPAHEMDPLSRWAPEMERGATASFPLSASTHDIATDLLAVMMAGQGSVLWLKCPSATRIDWLTGQVRRMAGTVSAANTRLGEGLRRRWFNIEWSRAGESDEALEVMFNAMETRCEEAGPAVFLFRDCSPAVLTVLIQRTGILRWRHLMAVLKPVFVLASRPSRCAPGFDDWLEDNLGTGLQHYNVPLLSVDDCLRYLRFCQPSLERQWQVEIEDAALRIAASIGPTPADGNSSRGNSSDGPDMDPDVALNLLKDALNTKLVTQANGSAALCELRTVKEDLERRRVVAEARSESTTALDAALDEVCLELAAEEVHWSELAAATALTLRQSDVLEQARRSSCRGTPEESQGDDGQMHKVSSRVPARRIKGH